jgi:peptide/nickel transport system ATP-binding protein
VGTVSLLEVEDLSVTFTRRGRRDVHAVDGVSFGIDSGQTLGLVGESGSGKSVTSLAIMGLLPRRGVRIGGAVRFEDRELLRLRRDDLRDLRGKDIAMVFQDPLSSLNPVVPIGTQVTEVLIRHRKLSGSDARREAVRLLDLVGIPDPDRRLREYAHQLSGGMRQRALIAMAVACKPKLLIADEPTTALDVTIQAQILELLKELVREQGTALVLITHDLGVVAGLCDRVNVMYSGRIVEQADRRTLFVAPRHPYTTGLLGSIPRLDSVEGSPLRPIPGSPTDTLPWSSACAFAPRCPRKLEVCTTVTPELEPDGPRWLRCHNPVPAEEAAKVGAEGRR